jgi:tetratricopeptide (TPR) repeat protein
MFDNYKQGNYTVALTYGKESLRLTENKYGKNTDIYITSLSTVAIIYEAMDSTLQAEEILKEGLNISNNRASAPNINIMILNGLASLYQSQEKYSEAEPYYFQALEIIRRNNLYANPLYFTILKSLGNCSENKGNLNDAEKYYLLALDHLKKSGKLQSSDYIDIYGTIASLYKKSGKYSKSEESYLEILDMIKNRKYSPADYAYYLNGLGGLYHNLNNYEKAERCYTEAKDIRLKLFGDSSVDYAQSLNNLALLNDDIGKLNESEAMYKSALKIWAKVYGTNSPIYAITLNNLAVLIGKMGRAEEAIKLISESLKIRKNAFNEESLSYANSLNNAAVLFKNLGYYPESEKLLQKAISLYEEKLGKEHPDYITALSNLASVYDAEEKYEEAEKYYFTAISIRKKLLGVKSADYANSLHNIGILYFRMKEYRKADEYLSSAMDIRKEVLGVKHPDYILSVSNMARLKEALNNYDESKKLWLYSLDMYLDKVHSVFPALSEDEKTKFYNNINEKFEMFSSFVMRHYKHDSQLLNDLIKYQIEIKGMLLNSLGKMRNIILSGSDESLKSLYTEWITTKEQLASLYNQPKEKAEKLSVNTDSLENLANEYEKKLSLQSEGYLQKLKTKDYTIDDLKKSIQHDERIVEVIRFRYNDITWNDSTCYAFLIISKDKMYPEIIYMMDGNDLEGKYYSDYINLIKNRINDKVSYRRFFEKIMPALDGVKAIYYSPDGVYNKINLITLRKSDGSYPLKNIDISIITGLKELFKKSTNNKSIDNVALFGNPAFQAKSSGDMRDIPVNPLPGTEIEVKNIQVILDKYKVANKIFLQTEANVQNLKTLKNPTILHIATHGFFMEDVENLNSDNFLGINKEKMKSNPLLRSGLILSGSGNKISDTSRVGVLTSYEAMNMNLDSSLLVVLSACETGLGELRNGEGVYGLQRAFMVAGAKYIIMSLWKVNDEVTSELMINFYDYFSQSGDVKAAFKKAQLRISEKYTEPLYWGAFIVLGI